MKILAIERKSPGLTKRDFVPYLRDEAATGWEMYKEGVIRETYFREDRPEAVLVLECDSLEEAQKHLSKLPLVANGMISFELIPLKAYHGYERLFDKEKMK